MLKHTEEYASKGGKFMARYFVKPGITGLAQSTLLLVAVNLGFIAFAFSFDFLGDNILMPIMVSVAILFSLVLNQLVRRSLSRTNFNARRIWHAVNKSPREAS
jgi:hypothetical protein